MISQSHSAKATRDKEILSKLPDTPGVYFFRNKAGSILYIGKATSLKDRVRSYFSKDLSTSRGPVIVKMIGEFANIDFQATDSVLEALILEANLIKKYQPPYNTLQKDNKSFNCVVITKEDFPRVLLARSHDLERSTWFPLKTAILPLDGRLQGDLLPYKIAYSFGPFPNGTSIKDGLKLVRKIFPFRDTCTPKSELADPSKAKPCFNRQIGLCPGVCTGEVSKAEYKETIKNIIEFFRGNKKAVIKNLEKQMKEFASKREFEKASEVKRKIFALNHIHDVSLIKQENLEEKNENMFRIEAYDVAHMSGKDVVGVMTVVENSLANKAEYRKFKITPLRQGSAGQAGNNDVGSLRQMLRRRLNHDEWRLPNLIVVDGAAAQKNAAEAVLLEYGYEIPVMAVTKNEYHKPKNILGERQFLVHESAILLANAEAHRYGIAYHKKLRERLK